MVLIDTLDNTGNDKIPWLLISFNPMIIIDLGMALGDLLIVDIPFCVSEQVGY
jgi:hypothetical protein